MRKFVSLGLKEAQAIIACVITKATADGGAPVAVAVTGIDGRLIAFEIMDGTITIAGPLAIAKARTAALRGLETKELAERTPPPDPGNYPGLELCFMPGGVIVETRLGEIVGAIGVSGRKGCATAEDPDEMHDHELARWGRQVIG